MGSFARLSALPAFLPHSTLICKSVSAWSMSPESLSLPQKQYTSRCFVSSSNLNRDDESTVHTLADITETIRHESLMEMKKVSKLFKTQQSSTRLIKSGDELTSYLISNNIQNYLFDCDGVLYRGADPMPDASKAIQALLDAGKQVFFVTNNAGSSRIELKNKLEQILRLTLHENMMIGSAYVAAQYLRSRLIKDNESTNKRVHIIGTSGLVREVQAAGFVVSGGPDPIDTPSGMSRDELADYAFSEGEIDAMVIGLDNDFNYRKLCIATVLLQRNPQALLVATNRDAFDLVGYDARHLPGNGALVSSVEAASERNAINVGKPSAVLAEWMFDEYKLSAEETIMIGDRLDTDIKFGSGMKCSALVLTGCATAAEVEDIMVKCKDESERGDASKMMPTIIFPHEYMMSLISSYPRFASAVDALEQMNNVFAFVNSADPFEIKIRAPILKDSMTPVARRAQDCKKELL